MDQSRVLPVPAHQVALPLLARRASELLEAGVPLTLLIDLAAPAGPRSRDVYDAEPGDAAWLLPTR